MGIRYHVDKLHYIMVLTVEGYLTDKQLLFSLKQALSDPAVGPNIRVLFDLRQAKLLDLSANTIRAAANITKSGGDRLSGARLAIVCSTDHVFGLARMFQTLRDRSPGEVKVFRKINQAKGWLNTNYEQPTLLDCLSAYW